MKRNDIHRQLVVARSDMLDDHPFFALLAHSLGLEPDTAIDTFQTDGLAIYYNPAYAEFLDHDLRQTAIAHETMHVAGFDFDRAKDILNVSLPRWNDAGDYYINGVLAKAGMKLHPSWLHHPRFDGLSKEQIYWQIASPTGAQRHKKTGTCCRPMPKRGKQWQKGKRGKSPVSVDAKDRIINTVLAAAAAAKAAGKLPGALEEWVRSLTQPPRDWTSELRLFLEMTNRNNYDWSQPNRRYVQLGVYLPRLRSKQKRPFVIALDTSGSITTDQYATFLGHMSNLLRQVRVQSVWLIQTDAEVQRFLHCTPAELVDQAPAAKGRGGTLFAPTFKHVAEQHIRPGGLVYFTDMEPATWPDEQPDYPVLWVTHVKDKLAPWGHTVQIN